MTLVSSLIKGAVTTFGEEASPALQKFRMNICNACPKKKNTPGVGPTCGTFIKDAFTSPDSGTCGCVLDAKTALKNESCPQTKW